MDWTQVEHQIVEDDRNKWDLCPRGAGRRQPAGTLYSRDLRNKKSRSTISRPTCSYGSATWPNPKIRKWTRIEEASFQSLRSRMLPM